MVKRMSKKLLILIHYTALNYKKSSKSLQPESNKRFVYSILLQFGFAESLIRIRKWCYTVKFQFVDPPMGTKVGLKNRASLRNQ